MSNDAVLLDLAEKENVLEWFNLLYTPNDLQYLGKSIDLDDLFIVYNENGSVKDIFILFEDIIRVFGKLSKLLLIIDQLNGNERSYFFVGKTIVAISILRFTQLKNYLFLDFDTEKKPSKIKKPLKSKKA